jgi:rSAM/selenodomain-associated transferase 1
VRLNQRSRDQVTAALCAIGIVSKVLKVGVSKSRLCPPLKPEECAELSRCFLKDTAENVSKLAQETDKVVPVGIYAPAGGERDFGSLLPDDFLLLAQRGEDLGERLRNAAEALFLAGFSSVCFVGADSPTLPRSYLAQMVGYVSNIEKGVALGPSADGGYYAIGLRTFMPRLFEEIDWSTNRVFEQTMARIDELAIPRLILPEWYDVDDWVALRRLYGELSGLGRTRQAGYLAIHTQRFLAQLPFLNAASEAQRSEEGT